MQIDELMATPEVRQLERALCLPATTDDAQALLLDLCTPKEISDLAQRLDVARLLAAGESYHEVSRVTGASSTTVSRVSKCLNGKRGGYRMVLDRMEG
ncbi:MAG: YerC/YecD family TrpR-related protein [Atopobiaceae bacterium]|jgi:TrpR-related protein YerC/YecD|nr:YerC/YecD family TrpR-related protein [Atopobiaceae bacterium]MCH4180563.1 YerC/YecD family TrpR-related protein [Atopobiaceae bacterium]MCH4214288.1 YerC/YecD family TrpR-related protein [Atopobiaceae bacterium]MCH4229415.1 YerC/YecD family TrpR-related protein [Atopobiaceae bacterium]MCH4276113.1 YerC/YecD family TrpR-related protein [Atopobiaceae bacterium]